MEQVFLKDVSLKLEAYRVYKKALRDGKLIRPTQCSECSKDCKPHGHHEDYSQPLEVVWLCINCHAHKEKLGTVTKLDHPALARNMYKSGMSGQEIATIIGCGRTTVWRWCKDLTPKKGVKHG